MEFLSILSAFIGGSIVWYLNRDAKKSITKEAYREASHIKTLEAVGYELEKLDEDAKRDGVLSEKNCAFMSALYGRWFDLQKQSNWSTR